MAARRTDLALEAHELWRAGAQTETLCGAQTRERKCFGYEVTTVSVTSAQAAETLGKPQGTYVTLDLRPYWAHGEDYFSRAVQALAEELRGLLKACGGRAALVAGLGNRDMTPDAIGPQTAEHILVTRHLMRELPFSQLRPVSVLTPGVLGRTGIEAAEILRGAVRTAAPDVLIAVDALASRSLSRVCTTVQLSDTGIVPGSGVGNRRQALDRTRLGIPVIAVGVPTVVDAATLALDLLEEAGVAQPDPKLLRGAGTGVMVTPRDIDSQIAELARVVGYGITLALQPLSFEELSALMS